MHSSIHTTKTGQELCVREAIPDDSAKLIAFLEDTSGESDNLSFGPGEFGTSEEEERKILEDLLKADSNIHLIALIDDEIVGEIGFNTGKRKRISHCGEFGMCVRKQFWKSGIGGILVDSLIRWAEQQGTIHKINLSVRTDNLPAIGLYLKKGFLIEGRILDSLRVDGRSFDTYRMGRRIEPIA